MVDWALELPGPAVVMQDAYDNVTHVLALDAPPAEIVLTARGRVEVDEIDEGEPAGRIDPRVFLRNTALTTPTRRSSPSSSRCAGPRRSAR